MDLLPLDEVRRRLRITGQSYAGIQEIPIARIVGSLDRTADFDRDFKPRRRGSKQRIARLRELGEFAAIEVYEVGGAYFVDDGHHRIALARETGAEFIDAEVTRLHTNYEVPPDTDVRELIHTEQQRRLMDESGLAQARPDLKIEFARPRGYPELLEAIKAHGYDMSRQRGALVEPRDVAADFHDDVWVPGIAAVSDAGLRELYPFKTEADLFLWLYERRRDLRVLDPDASFGDAAAYARDEGVSRRDRKIIESERANSLDSGG